MQVGRLGWGAKHPSGGQLPPPRYPNATCLNGRLCRHTSAKEKQTEAESNKRTLSPSKYSLCVSVAIGDPKQHAGYAVDMQGTAR